MNCASERPVSDAPRNKTVQIFIRNRYNFANSIHSSAANILGTSYSYRKSIRVYQKLQLDRAPC